MVVCEAPIRVESVHDCAVVVDIVPGVRAVTGVNSHCRAIGSAPTQLQGCRSVAAAGCACDVVANPLSVTRRCRLWVVQQTHMGPVVVHDGMLRVPIAASVCRSQWRRWLAWCANQLVSPDVGGWLCGQPEV